MKTIKAVNISTCNGRAKGMLAVCVGVLLATASGVWAAETAAPTDLKLFFQQNCARCHGTDGSGRDVAGKRLRGANFANPVWQQRTDDDAMAKVILKGKFFGLAMPSFKQSLSRDEALQMVRDVLRKFPVPANPVSK